MNLNYTLQKSMNTTNIKKSDPNSRLECIYVLIVRFEEFITVNRNSEKIIDKIVSYFAECITAGFISFLIGLIVSSFSGKTAYNYSNMSISLAFAIIPMTLILLNRKKDYNLASYFKIVVLIYELYKDYSKKRLAKELIIIGVTGAALVYSFYVIITAFFIPADKLGIKVLVLIISISYSTVYFLRKALTEDEWDAIYLNSVFVIITIVLHFLNSG